MSAPTSVSTVAAPRSSPNSANVAVLETRLSANWGFAMPLVQNCYVHCELSKTATFTVSCTKLLRSAQLLRSRGRVGRRLLICSDEGPNSAFGAYVSFSPEHSHRISRDKEKPVNPKTDGPHELAPRVGLEPTTARLTAECSTIELPRNLSTARLEVSSENPLRRSAIVSIQKL